jgi:hypothetical protein
VTPLVSSIDVPETTPTAPAPRVQPMTVSVDKERQLISLRLSYTSALIGGFGLFILVALAILIGKSMSKGPAPAIADQDTRALKSGPANPGVMNVKRTGDGSLNAADTEIPRSGGNSTGTRQPQRNDTQPPATFFTDDPRRTLGLNYAIIQSYPDKETADKAADFLTKNGVPCTVERELPGWPLPWRDGCVVVGIRGFSKVRDNPELEKYKKQIMELSAKFAQGRSRFVAFAPVMYSWKKAN